MEQYEHESERRGLPVERILGDDSDRRAATIAIGLAAASLVLLVFLALIVGGDGPWWFFALLAVVASAVLALAVHRARSWFSWGNPQLFLPSSEDLRLGDDIVARFRRSARGWLRPDQVELSAKLVCVERVRLTDRVVEETLLERPVETSLRATDGGPGLLQADLRIEVPLFEAPPSMTLLHHEITWHLQVSIVVAGAADDESTFPLVVAPAVTPRLLVGGGG